MDEELYNGRLATVRQQLLQWDVDAVLLTGYANRRWVSGFTGSNAKLLISTGQALLATDSRYYEQAERQSAHFELFRHERRAEDDSAFLKAIGVNTIGIDAANTTLKEADALKKASPDMRWVHLPQTVEPLRQVKTAVELEKIRKAASITDLAMSQVNELIQPGMSEKEVAWALEKTMREAGADSLAFPVLVASGPNSALPHHATGNRKIEPGDAIIIDMGAAIDGYCSDMTRSFFMGDAPTQEYVAVYETVLAAQTAVLTQAKAGMHCLAVDAIARDIIAQAGYKAHFGHGLGHGVGLAIHEDPFLSPRASNKEQIEAGMTLTVEPGIYIPGWGGVRIEDLTLVQEHGLERISHCAKTPPIPIL